MNGRRVRRVLRPDVNPVYQPPPAPKAPHSKRRWRWPRLRLWSAIFIAAFGLWWLLFLVRDIEVAGSQHPVEIEAEIKRAISRPFWYRHLFWLPPQAIAEKVASENPELVSSLSITKNWLSGSLRVEAEDRQAVLRWSANNQQYGVDQRGIITGVFKGEEGSALPLVVDSSNLDVRSGSAVAPGQFVAFVRQLNQQLPAKTKLKFQQGRVVETTNELLADTSGGFYLRLDTSRSVAEQLEALKILLDRKIKPAVYFDLRLPYKVYYR